MKAQRKKNNQHLFHNILQSSHGNPRQAVHFAYLAGLIDGEGTIRIDKLRAEKSGMKKKKSISPGYAIHISLGSVDGIMSKIFQRTFNVGSLRVERVAGKRPIYRWHVRGNKSTLPVIKGLMPYLIIKKPQAELALRLVAGWKTPKAKAFGVDPLELQRREDVYLKMRKLNAVGAAATTERDGTREGEATV
jgi:hypothetical protein